MGLLDNFIFVVHFLRFGYFMHCPQERKFKSMRYYSYSLAKLIVVFFFYKLESYNRPPRAYRTFLDTFYNFLKHSLFADMCESLYND
jgi:hypothetical protein